MKVTLNPNSPPDVGVTDSDETQSEQPPMDEVQKEAGPFAEIPDLCSRIDTIIYDVGCTPIRQDKEKILGKLIGAMELLQGNLK